MKKRHTTRNIIVKFQNSKNTEKILNTSHKPGKMADSYSVLGPSCTQRQGSLNAYSDGAVGYHYGNKKTYKKSVNNGKTFWASFKIKICM